MYLEYQLTQEDYVAAAALAARKRSWVTNLRYIRLVVVAVVLVIGAGASLSRGEGASAALLPLRILVVLFGAVLLGRNWLYARTFRNDLSLQTRRQEQAPAEPAGKPHLPKDSSYRQSDLTPLAWAQES